MQFCTVLRGLSWFLRKMQMYRWLIQYVKRLVCVVAGKTEPVDSRLAYSKVKCSQFACYYRWAEEKACEGNETCYSRTHVKRCKLVVSDASEFGNMIFCILTSKNQIYSWCSFITETEFTVSRLGLPNDLFGFPPKLKMPYLN